MDDQAHTSTTHRDDSDTDSVTELHNYSLLRHHTITTALSSLPRRSIFLRDCADSRSDGRGVNNCGTFDNSNSNAYYSKPIMVLDLVWNLAFVLVSFVVLLSSVTERPSRPLRVWISGYAFQCMLHVGFVYLDYKNRRVRDDDDDDDCDDRAGISGSSSSLGHSSFVKRLESANTIISSIWWMMGFYWILAGGQVLMQDSPRLYWLTVVFLAFDVFFIIFCIGMACIIFLAIFCCIPVLAIAYAVAVRKGASEDDIRSLPKYRYSQYGPLRTLGNNGKERGVFGTSVGSSNSNSTDGRVLLPEDSECCICLSRYVDGAELYSLPCNHHFHCGCISKWLRINATCPLCKFNIRSGDTLV